MRSIFMCIGLLFVFSVNAQQMTPLSKWDAERRSWKTDFSELTYVATRCGCNFDLVGNYFVEKGTTQTHKDNGEKFKKNAETYMLASLKFAPAAGLTEKDVLSRYKSFVALYVEQMKGNKKIDNTIFHGAFNEDFEFCVENYQYFKALVERVK